MSLRSFYIYLLICFFSLSGYGQEERIRHFDPTKELRNLGYDTIDGKMLMDKRAVIILQKMMKQSSLSKASPEQIRALILENIKGEPYESFMKRPKVMNKAIALFKDEKALPSLIGIFLRKDDLKKYFFIWLGIFIAGWLVDKFWVKKQEDWSSFGRFFMGLMISFLVMATSITIFYQMFYEELSPTVHILMNSSEVS